MPSGKCSSVCLTQMRGRFSIGLFSFSARYRNIIDNPVSKYWIFQDCLLETGFVALFFTHKATSGEKKKNLWGSFSRCKWSKQVKCFSHVDAVTQGQKMVSRLKFECWLLVQCVNHQYMFFFFFLEGNLLHQLRTESRMTCFYLFFWTPVPHLLYIMMHWRNGK